MRVRCIIHAQAGSGAPAQQKPFFLGVGLHKPHMPWSVPKRFFDLQPPASQIALPKHPLPPPGMPPVAFNPTGNCSAHRAMTDGHARAARRAYMAVGGGWGGVSGWLSGWLEWVVWVGWMGGYSTVINTVILHTRVQWCTDDGITASAAD